MTRIYLIRHGETEWSQSGQHTGTTDIELTAQGKTQAKQLQLRLQGLSFTTVLCSPLKRACQTCEFAGLQSLKQTDPRLVEWNYGDYEGLTTAQIHIQDPSWNIFCKGAPRGETPDTVRKRAIQVIASLETVEGNVALISHGHFLRALATVWINLPLETGKLFALAPASISVLGFEREQHVITLWNATH